MSKSARTRLDLSGRRGAVLIFVAVLLFTIVTMAAFAIDLGLIFVARSQLQNAADSAALAAAWELLDEDRLQGVPEMTAEIADARQKALDYAALNTVMTSSPAVDPNNINDMGGDVVVGYLSDPTNPGETMSLLNPTQFNSVQVRVRRDSVLNGPIDLTFGRLLGLHEFDLAAQATATFKDGVVGYKVTDQTGNAELLPLALKDTSWTALLNWMVTSGDNYTYDRQTGNVYSYPDGIPELNIYPGAGAGQLPPGNLGTVDIGSASNSTADIARQIRYGVNAADLAYYGGVLTLGQNGTLLMNGDTGLSASIKDDLESIKGLPRAIAVFSQVSGPGNNANYKIVGFAGIRILYVKLTGAMNKKVVVIQPAYVVDDSVITAPGEGSSYFVYEPVRLVR